MAGGIGPGGSNGFTVGGGTNADGTQNPGTRMMSVGGPYGPVIRVPESEMGIYNFFNRRRQQTTPARVQAPPQPVANTVLGGRETAAPTTAPTPGAPTTTADAGGAFAAILRLLQSAASGV